MIVVLLLLSVAFVLLGHLFRLLRWEQFIKIYERPARGALLQGMALGYGVNFLLPFHVGDLLRAGYAGRRMKSGMGFAFATVIMDRFLDVWVVTLGFAVFAALDGGNGGISGALRYYLIFSAVLAVALIPVLLLRDTLKKICLAVCNLFNENIRLAGLEFGWSIINTFKDLRRIKLGRLLANTLLMWAAYLASYGVLAHCLSLCGVGYRLADVFNMLFGLQSVDVTSFGVTGQLHTAGGAAQAVMLCWFLLPLAVMAAVTLLPWSLRAGLNRISSPGDGGEEYLNLLPQADPHDRDAFLSQYFGLQNKEYVGKFIAVNQNITILQDYSAGSNATTMLCMDATGTFYRKYAFGEDGDKLALQLAWLQQQQAVLPLCDILRSGVEPGSCWYDMAYTANAVGMFRFIHSNPTEKSAATLTDVLQTLQTKLYTPTAQKPQPGLVEEYLCNKVDKNLARLKENRQLRELMAYDCIRINGVACKNLPELLPMLGHSALQALFCEDPIATIHGDLTIENIICRTDAPVGEKAWYLIDPNTGNVHESPFLDYAKLLQSLHGGYEFMMMTPRVSVQENRIDFAFTRSAAYDALFAAVREYLGQQFTPRQVQSIFMHEVIHWLRLMPYKLNRDKKRAAMFYAGLLLVMNDVDRWYGSAAPQE